MMNEISSELIFILFINMLCKGYPFVKSLHEIILSPDSNKKLTARMMWKRENCELMDNGNAKIAPFLIKMNTFFLKNVFFK